MLQSYDIVGSYNNQRSMSIDAERTVNMFEYIDEKGKKSKSLISTSGLVNTNNSFYPETGGGRGQFVYKGKQYIVFGGTVFVMLPNGVVTTIGFISTSSGYVGIAANTFQIIFVDGSGGWIYDTNVNTFTRITDDAFPQNPVDVTNLDGFFVVAAGGTNTFLLSMFEQGLVWGASLNDITISPSPTNMITVSPNTNNFQTGVPVQLVGAVPFPVPLTAVDTYYCIRINAVTIQLASTYLNAINNHPIVITTAGTPPYKLKSLGQLQQGAINTSPGTIVGCAVLYRRLFLFSQNFTEVWENAGVGTNLPFRRNNSLLLEVGTPSVSSIAVGFGKMFFLSQDKDGISSIVKIEGTQAFPVSNRSLDYQISQYAFNPEIGIEDSSGFLVKEKGIVFYRLNFTKANHTFVFNDSMSDLQNLLWHEEEVLNGDRHPSQSHAFYNGKNYVSHYKLPILYVLDDNVPTNDGESIRRMRIGRPIGDDTYKRIRIDRWHLDLLQGQDLKEFNSAIFILTESGVPILTEDGIPLITQDNNSYSSNKNPIVFLSYSKDGGQTYGHRLEGLMGKVGERKYRTVWRRLGTVPRGQFFVPKIEFFNDQKFIVLGAAWNFEVLPE